MIIKFLQSQGAEQERVGIAGSLNRRGGADDATTGEHMEAILPRESSRIVAAHLAERDYELAKLTIPELGAFEDYADWLDFRAGAFFGLEIAGYSVEFVPVDLAKFATWRRTTSTPPSISALDQFARSFVF
jgi:hypothetical protein